MDGLQLKKTFFSNRSKSIMFIYYLYTAQLEDACGYNINNILYLNTHHSYIICSAPLYLFTACCPYNIEGGWKEGL